MNERAIDYDYVWGRLKLRAPESAPIFKLISSYFREAENILEIGPGTRPNIPIAGHQFLDNSSKAIALLNRHGGIGTVADANGTLPYPNAHFEAVCAFDVLEHLPNDVNALDEVFRILKPGGYFLFSVPVFEHHWTAYDTMVGHCRRYDPKSLYALLAQHYLPVERVFMFRSVLVSWLVRFPLTKLLVGPWIFLVRHVFLGPAIVFEDKISSRLFQKYIVQPRELHDGLQNAPSSTLRVLVVARKDRA